MFGITLRRSAATLGVVAGLLAAAAPANAKPAGISGPVPTADSFGLTFEHLDVKAPSKAVVVLIGANDYGFADTRALL